MWPAQYYQNILSGRLVKVLSPIEKRDVIREEKNWRKITAEEYNFICMAVRFYGAHITG